MRWTFGEGRTIVGGCHAAFTAQIAGASSDQRFHEHWRSCAAWEGAVTSGTFIAVERSTAAGGGEASLQRAKPTLVENGC